MEPVEFNEGMEEIEEIALVGCTEHCYESSIKENNFWDVASAMKTLELSMPLGRFIPELKEGGDDFVRVGIG